MLHERILRFTLGIVFVWMGILIAQHGESYTALLASWVIEKLPIGVTVSHIIMGVGIFDIIIGLWLLFGVYPKTAATIAAVHLAAVLVVTSKDLQSVRIADIGLLGAAVSLALTKQTIYFED